LFKSVKNIIIALKNLIKVDRETTLVYMFEKERKT